jgi:hypothetical protein
MITKEQIQQIADIVNTKIATDVVTGYLSSGRTKEACHILEEIAASIPIISGLLQNNQVGGPTFVADDLPGRPTIIYPSVAERLACMIVALVEALAVIGNEPSDVDKLIQSLNDIGIKRTIHRMLPMASKHYLPDMMKPGFDLSAYGKWLQELKPTAVPSGRSLNNEDFQKAFRSFTDGVRGPNVIMDNYNNDVISSVNKPMKKKDN